MDQTKRAGQDDCRIYLCAPINALVEGIYEENIAFTEIKQHGDFGLGTFDDLDGEMVMLDGHVYQMTADGHVTKVADQTQTPFACVTIYRPQSRELHEGAMSYTEFQSWLSSLMPSPNLFYAFKIEGLFSHVKVRSVPKHECYTPLVEVTKEQPVYNFMDIAGTLAGFYTPSFMSLLNVPGLHLHFLSQDRQHGGHLLECQPQSIQVGIQSIHKLELSLPLSLDYLTLDFHRDIEQDLNKSEK